MTNITAPSFIFFISRFFVDFQLPINLANIRFLG